MNRLNEDVADKTASPIASRSRFWPAFDVVSLV